jgi:hypothetical protein
VEEWRQHTDGADNLETASRRRVNGSHESSESPTSTQLVAVAVVRARVTRVRQERHKLVATWCHRVQHTLLLAVAVSRVR